MTHIVKRFEIRLRSRTLDSDVHNWEKTTTNNQHIFSSCFLFLLGVFVGEACTANYADHRSFCVVQMAKIGFDQELICLLELVILKYTLW